MAKLKNTLKSAALGALVAGGALAVSTTAALADVACNQWGECWHVASHDTYYPANVGVVFHDDAWREHHRHHVHWFKDHDGDRGYWAHGAWVVVP